MGQTLRGGHGYSLCHLEARSLERKQCPPHSENAPSFATPVIGALGNLTCVEIFQRVSAQSVVLSIEDLLIEFRCWMMEAN